MNDELLKVEPEVVVDEVPDPKNPQKHPVRKARYTGRIKATMKDGSILIFADEGEFESWGAGKPAPKKKKAGEAKPQPPVPATE